MYDFGATLGSATRFAEPAGNNHEYLLDDGSPALKSLFTLGLAVPKYLKNRPSNLPPPSARFDSESFDPVRLAAELSESGLRADAAGRRVLGGAAGVAVFQ